MIATYFKIALRYLAKNKVYSMINVAGLSLSLACAMLIILYAKDEHSFDKFHKDIHSTYLIAINVLNPDGSTFDKLGHTSSLHGPRFTDNIPEIESFLRLTTTYRDIRLSDDVISQKILEADSNFFSFFNFPLLQGNLKTALRDVRSIVISEEMAIRHFGTADAFNKTILLNSDGSFHPYTVTGVARRCPQNSSIQFEAVIPIQEKPGANWVGLSLATFIKVAPRSDLKSTSSKMQQVFEAESKEMMEQVRSYGFTQSFHHVLQPMAEVHLNQEYKAGAGLTNASNPVYSYILSGIAAFILIVACINFINLTIARSSKRAREIGIRKVVGGGRQQLIEQFLGESFLLCFFSFIVAMVITQLILPVFSNLVNKELSLSYLIDGKLILIYISLCISTGLMAGFYPAIVLSGYHPVQTLYSRSRLFANNYFQKSLIVFQFALATFMIIATLTVYLQFDYLTNKNLGYEPDDVVKIEKRNLTSQEAKIFTEELSKNSHIASVSPQRHQSMNGKINADSTIMNFTYDVIGEKFLDLLKIQIIEGRNFSPANASDSINAVIVNESFVRNAGWDEPLGQQVKMMDGARRTIIGVVKDYNYESLKTKIEPQLFTLAFDPSNASYQHLLIRIQPGSESASLALVGSTFKKLFPMQPYSYQFYNEINLLRYEAESKWKQVILLSAVLTIFIAGIGLFGLSIMTAESRFKEIGIRKVLGATATSIVVKLYREHLALISLALIIAIPAAYYACGAWLENYPYRTDVGAATFIGTALFVMAIAILTITYQTIKTASLNPVDSLRTD
jgi:putative ABC transport system permease protein